MGGLSCPIILIVFTEIIAKYHQDIYCMPMLSSFPKVRMDYKVTTKMKQNTVRILKKMMMMMTVMMVMMIIMMMMTMTMMRKGALQTNRGSKSSKALLNLNFSSLSIPLTDIWRFHSGLLVPIFLRLSLKILESEKGTVFATNLGSLKYPNMRVYNYCKSSYHKGKYTIIYMLWFNFFLGSIFIFHCF